MDLDQVETFGDLTVRRLSEHESILDLASIDDWEDAPSADDDVRRGPHRLIRTRR